VVLEIVSDCDYRYFEIRSKDKRFSDYPGGVNMNPWGTGWFYPIKGNWYKELKAIASWVNNELKDGCEFTLA
jgi:hypothetical protein